MSTQPEAWRLANSIKWMDTFTDYQRDELDRAAAELRRLHEENEILDKRLEEAIEDMKSLLKRPPWHKCLTHGPAHPNEWACPSCLRELRSENEKFRQHIENQNKELDQLIPVAERLERVNAELLEALRGVLPYMEAAEEAGLVGDEGCHWPVEAVRAAIARAEGETK